jgi:LEA14-like dessication related protein
VIFEGCSYLKLFTFKIPEIKNIKKVVYKKIELNKAQLIFTVDVNNKNDFDLNLISSDYQVYLEGSYLGKGSTDKHQVILKNSISELEFPLTINLLDAFRNGLSVLSIISGSENLLYHTKGNAMVSFEGIDRQFEVPLDIENRAKIYNE